MGHCHWMSFTQSVCKLQTQSNTNSIDRLLIKWERHQQAGQLCCESEVCQWQQWRRTENILIVPITWSPYTHFPWRAFKPDFWTHFCDRVPVLVKETALECNSNWDNSAIWPTPKGKSIDPPLWATAFVTDRKGQLVYLIKLNAAEHGCQKKFHRQTCNENFNYLEIRDNLCGLWSAAVQAAIHRQLTSSSQGWSALNLCRHFRYQCIAHMGSSFYILFIALIYLPLPIALCWASN